MDPSALWNISLDPRLLREGTYFQFESGKAAAFAVEFFSMEGLKVLSPARAPGTFGTHPKISARLIEDSEYDVIARVAFIGEDYWVIDLGILVFCEGDYPVGLKVGDFVSGQVLLSVDSFFYFQYASKDQDAPALVYDWTLKQILEIETPNIKMKDERGREFFHLASERALRVKVLKTNSTRQRTQETRVDYILTGSTVALARRPAVPGLAP